MIPNLLDDDITAMVTGIPSMVPLDGLKEVAAGILSGGYDRADADGVLRRLCELIVRAEVGRDTDSEANSPDAG